MRVRSVVALLLAGVFCAPAQAVELVRGEPAAALRPAFTKPKNTCDSETATGVQSPSAHFRRSEIIATPPDRDTLEFAEQMLHEPFRFPNVQLETVEWNQLDGWRFDDHVAAFAAFHHSCRAIVRGTPAKVVNPQFFAALQSTCRRAVKAPAQNAAAAKIFFERNFRPMRIATLGEPSGFLTGYYEPIIEGSLKRTAEFNVPLYRTPPEAANRGGAQYHDRSAIEDGVLNGRGLELCWLKDPTDLFFAQIQGSARVRLEDGKILRLNYSGHNGWKYTPIGRILIDREIVPKEEMSMDRIREWIDANPKEGKELRRRNKSYVFFRDTGLGEHEEPMGAQGVSLTPWRSIAVDRSIHVYGTPFYIEAELPLQSERSENLFQRLMVSQDTGGAIKGPARADLYFGSLPGSASMAGRIRHQGQFTILIPREIDPVIAGRNTPLPQPRPVFPGDADRPEIASEAASEQK